MVMVTVEPTGMNAGVFACTVKVTPLTTMVVVADSVRISTELGWIVASALPPG